LDDSGKTYKKFKAICVTYLIDGAYYFLSSSLKDLILKLTLFPNRFHILSVSSILDLELDSLMRMFNDLMDLGFLQVSSDPFMYGKTVFY
jgi:hypothetical protein